MGAFVKTKSVDDRTYQVFDVGGEDRRKWECQTQRGNLNRTYHHIGHAIMDINTDKSR